MQAKPSPILCDHCGGRGRRYAIRSLWPHPLPSTLVDLLRPTRIDDNLIAPIALRMHRAETLRYIPLAFLMAPAIHMFFSLVVGWHDYMPFPIYIPSLVEQLHRLSH